MSRKGRSIGVLGLGVAVPEKVLTNLDLEKMVDTSDEWIRARTGIRERRIVKADEAASDLGARAARAALADAGISADQIDLLITGTFTTDTLCPSTACHIQGILGVNGGAAFDLNAACTSFVYGLSAAKNFLASGQIKYALVIGVDVMSRFLDFQDRNTCVLFGDGAGAVVVGPVEDERRGFLADSLCADGRMADLISIPAGGSRQPASRESVEAREHFLRMNGNEVFRFAVRVLGESVLEALDKCDMKPGDLDLVVPHQANRRIIEAAARKLNLPLEKFAVYLEKYGNTSAASIPLALEEARLEGRLEKGSLVALVAFGGGMTWGTNILRW